MMALFRKKRTHAVRRFVHLGPAAPGRSVDREVENALAVIDEQLARADANAARKWERDRMPG